MDLEELPRYFPDGDVYAIEENGKFYLLGSALESLADAEAIRAEAARRLDLFAAAISLLWTSMRKPRLGNVIREEDGKRRIFIEVEDTVSSRSKVSATISGSPVQPVQKTQAQEILARADKSPHLKEALQVWADPLRSWPRLYRVLEELERHLGQSVDKAGFCSNNEKERFTRSANSAHVSGIDARHAGGKFQPPANPMTLREATDFVRKMLIAVTQE
jgi:hypothetical protein